jgi:hypothetical protein
MALDFTGAEARDEMAAGFGLGQLLWRAFAGTIEGREPLAAIQRRFPADWQGGMWWRLIAALVIVSITFR